MRRMRHAAALAVAAVLGLPGAGAEAAAPAVGPAAIERPAAPAALPPEADARLAHHHVYKGPPRYKGYKHGYGQGYRRGYYGFPGRPFFRGYLRGFKDGARRGFYGHHRYWRGHPGPYYRGPYRPPYRYY